MADQRSVAKAGILQESDKDPDLEIALSEARRFELMILKERNAHERELEKVRRGLLGKFFGDEKLAANFAAITAIVAGILLFGVCIWQFNEAVEGAQQFWERSANAALAFASGALGFIFGRSAGDK